MTCTYDEEIIALYISGDLDEPERQAAAVHLSACATCSLKLEQFREDARSLSRSVHSVAFPTGLRGRRPGRPLRPWLVTAASVLLVSVLAAWQAPALAGQVIRWMHNFQTRHLTADQADRQFEENRTHEQSGRPVESGPMTAAEAAAAVGHPVAVPGYLPDGYRLEAIWVRTAPTRKTVKTVFRRPDTGARLYLYQDDVGDTRVVVDVREGSGQAVTVNGRPALAVFGSYTVFDGHAPIWNPGTAITLHFPWERYRMILSAPVLSGQEPLTLDEVTRVAESLK